jgi:hypothetical protein
MKQKKDKSKYGGFFTQAIGFFPLVFLALILFLARGSMMDMIDHWGEEPPRGEGEPILDRHIFVQDQYHRRDVVDPDEVVELSNGVYSVQYFSGSDMDVTEMEFKFSNGDTYQHTQLPFSEYLTGVNKYKMLVNYEFKNGWVTYFDPDTEEWVINRRLRSGVSLPMTMAFVNIENETYLILDQPYSYSPGEDGNIIAHDEVMGMIYMNPRGYGFDFVIGYPIKENICNEMWILESKEPLVDMENPEAIFKTGETSQEFWTRCGYGAEHRFLMDGYYSKTPTTYSGYQANAFWRNPGVHVPYNYIMYGADRASEDLGYLQLYMSSLNITEDGYFKTEPESKWLNETYEIDGGYYDTRFNADMGVALITAYQKYNEPYFLEQAKEMLNFYTEFAQDNHYTFYNNLSEQGWLVQDYWHENENCTPVHSSLNHQLQEMYFLYLMGTELKDVSVINLADKLLKGIEITTDIWIKPDGDLYYGYIADGTFDKNDYPDLTYNDMYNVQNLFVDMGRSRNESLDKLMKSKKMYMDAEGITSYFQ